MHIQKTYIITFLLILGVLHNSVSQDVIGLPKTNLAKLDLNGKGAGIDPNVLSNADKIKVVNTLNSIQLGLINELKSKATPVNPIVGNQVANRPANPKITLFRNPGLDGQLPIDQFRNQTINSFTVDNFNFTKANLQSYKSILEQAQAYQSRTKALGFINTQLATSKVTNATSNFIIRRFNEELGRIGKIFGGGGEIEVPVSGVEVPFDISVLQEIIEDQTIRSGVLDGNVDALKTAQTDLKIRSFSNLRESVRSFENLGVKPVLAEDVPLSSGTFATWVTLEGTQLSAWEKDAGLTGLFTPEGVGNQTKGFSKYQTNSGTTIKKGDKVVNFQPGIDNFTDGIIYTVANSGDVVFSNNFNINETISSIEPFFDSNGNINSDVEFSFSSNTLLSDLLNRGDPSGIDFRNVKVAAIDIESATKTVRLILKGDQFTDTSSPASSLNTDSKLAKEVFLQALAIPNDRQFVSLDIIGSGGQAVADSNFKKTKMAPIFFEADADMKKDVAEYLLGTGIYGTRTGIYEKWIEALKTHNIANLNTLVSRHGSKIIPRVNVKGTIVPRTLSGGDSDSKAFISNSDYNLIMTVENIPNIFNDITNATDRTYLQNRWVAFQGAFFTEVNAAGTTVRDRINAGATSDYRKLLAILPSIIAAHWYKQAPSSTKTQFSSLINTSNLSTATTGISLSDSFDQNYFNSLANQVLAEKTINITVNGSIVTGRLQLRGGIEVEQIDIEALGGNTQSSIITTVSSDNNGRIGNSVTGAANDQFIYGGTPDYNLPELQIASFTFDNDNATVDINNPVEYELNEGIEFRIAATNLGNVNASNVDLDIFVKEPGSSGFTKIQGVNRDINIGDQSFLIGNFVPGAPGTYELRAVVDSDDKINEIEEVSSNQYTRKFKVNTDFICNSDVDFTELKVNFAIDQSDIPLFINSRNLIAGNNSKFIVTSSGKAIIHATNKIVFKPGTIFRTGSKVRSFISSCQDANTQYKNEVTRTSSSLAKTSKKIYTAQEIISSKNESIADMNIPMSDELKAVKEMLNRRGNVEQTASALQEDIQEGLLIKMYPNPVINILHIEHDIPDISSSTFAIYTVEGKLIKRIAKNNINQNKINVDIKDLDSGLYILKITGNLRRYEAMFIKK